MTAAGPVRDSALDAIGYAARVLTKPRFWLVPIVLSTITTLPLLAIPLPPGMAGMSGFSTSVPAPVTPAEFEAYLRIIIPVVAASLVLSMVLGPLLSATAFRLGAQYVDGNAPRPFGPGLLGLAWRFFLLELVILVLYLVAGLLVLGFFAVAQALLGLALTFLIVAVVVLVGSVALAVRFALAPVLLLSGAGPIAALRLSWEMTRGHFRIAFRWLFVTWLLVAVISSLLGAAIGTAFAAIHQPMLGQVVAGAVSGPVLVIDSIVVILLARLLSGPIEPPLPPPVPAWMTGSAQDQAMPTPSTQGGQ